MDLFLVLLQLCIIAAYVGRDVIIGRFPESAKTWLALLAADMKFRIGSWGRTILVPVLVILLSYIVWVYCCRTLFGQFPALTFTESLLLHFIESCILAPLSEEILQCVFLSAVFLAFARIYQNRMVLSFMLFAALMIISYVFANVHINPTPLNWLVRFFQFMIYGGLYYLNDRNLLPAFVAHATWNTVIMGAGMVSG